MKKIILISFLLFNINLTFAVNDLSDLDLTKQQAHRWQNKLARNEKKLFFNNVQVALRDYKSWKRANPDWREQVREIKQIRKNIRSKIKMTSNPTPENIKVELNLIIKENKPKFFHRYYANTRQDGLANDSFYLVAGYFLGCLIQENGPCFDFKKYQIGLGLMEHNYSSGFLLCTAPQPKEKKTTMVGIESAAAFGPGVGVGLYLGTRGLCLDAAFKIGLGFKATLVLATIE